MDLSSSKMADWASGKIALYMHENTNYPILPGQARPPPVAPNASRCTAPRAINDTQNTHNISGGQFVWKSIFSLYGLPLGP